MPAGLDGLYFNGLPGTPGNPGSGVGGGLDLITGGTATIDNTNVILNQADTMDDNVHGIFRM
jgi:hypothetical protein